PGMRRDTRAGAGPNDTACRSPCGFFTLLGCGRFLKATRQPSYRATWLRIVRLVDGEVRLRAPVISSTTPLATAAIPTTGGSLNVFSRSAVAWMGPRSMTVSLLV